MIVALLLFAVFETGCLHRTPKRLYLSIGDDTLDRIRTHETFGVDVVEQLCILIFFTEKDLSCGGADLFEEVWIFSVEVQIFLYRCESILGLCKSVLFYFSH